MRKHLGGGFSPIEWSRELWLTQPLFSALWNATVMKPTSPAQLSWSLSNQSGWRFLILGPSSNLLVLETVKYTKKEKRRVCTESTSVSCNETSGANYRQSAKHDTNRSKWEILTVVKIPFPNIGSLEKTRSKRTENTASSALRVTTWDAFMTTI